MATVLAPATLATATSRFDTIDTLRGMSILSVILLHTWLRFSFGGFHVTRGMPTWLGQLLFRNGGNGVTLFFAISGFLITLTSVRRFGTLAAMKPLSFYRIRFARIAPLLLLILAIFSVLHLLRVDDFFIHKPNASLAGALFSALTFSLNAYEAFHMHSWLPACWTVLWSLSIEEMFYLCFPILCFTLLPGRFGKAVFMTLLLFLMALGCFARTGWSHGDGLLAENSYFGGFGLIASGVLAGLVTHHLSTRRKALSTGLLVGLQIGGAALIMLFAIYPRWAWIKPFLHFTGRSGTDDMLLALGVCLVMVGSVLRNRAGRVWLTPVRWLGRHSYELYLTHEFVVVSVVNHYLKLQVTRNPGPLLAYTVAIVLLTVPIAWTLARFFSEPLNRLLRGARSTAPRPVLSATLASQ